ncbi:MAG: protein kinase [SAR86 cluster bacterium]|uniref:Protein kinase n=1 Tax=SAR86 cluster bacterium TaxID=2030880 RepID=A0A2A5ASW7_9GAMM|nr:MAG: protein kinase [SAR86 cluster bacterium]
MQISIGSFSDKGRKSANQDSQGVRLGEGSLLQTKGIAAAIADGVSSSEHGAEASSACVLGFLTDYFSTPETWSVKKSVEQVCTALNGWLYRQGDSITAAHRGRVTTLSAVVFKSTTAHIFHIGDSRIYRIRHGDLEQLTVDHRTWVSAEKSYLSRAMGVDTHLQIDYSRVTLETGDIYLLSTDGVHDYLTDKEVISIILSSQKDLAKAAELLARKAMSHDSPDNVSCQILRIDELPARDADEVFSQLTELPFPPDLNEGLILDGYKIVRELHTSSRSQLYLVIDSDTGLQLALKTPSVNYEDDPAYIERFTMEEWVGRRINNPHVLKVYEPTRRRRFLYHIAEYLQGPTLRQWMIDNPSPDIEAVRAIIEQVANGLQAFHRLEMLHQDIKPENIIVGNRGALKIVDFGSVKVAGIAEIDSPVYRSNLLGTKNYSSPENLAEKVGSNASDIYSLGVITYEMLSGGHLPYGEIPSTKSRIDFKKLSYIPCADFNENIPSWLDGMLKKSVSPDPSDRYYELSEFLYDLRNPNKSLIFKDQRPLIERRPVQFWQGVSGLLAITLAASLIFLLS